MQSTVNLLQDDPEQEPCNPVPAPSSYSTTTVDEQTTSVNCRDRDQIDTTSSHSVPSKLPRSQASTHMKKKPTASPKMEEVDSYWEAQITPLLRDLDESASDIARLRELSGTLWSHLEGKGLLGRTGGDAGTKRRAAVLKCLFRLLDHTDSHLLLRLARVILAVSGSAQSW